MKVNLGSGYLGLDGWVNIDNSPLARASNWHMIPLLVKLRLIPEGWRNTKWPRGIMLKDIRGKRLPFEDSSVDYIYASHFLEHLKRFECIKVLKESHRILKNEGIMRIAVPDLELIAKKYVMKDRQFFVEKMKQPENRTLCDIFVDLFYAEPNYSKQRFKSRVQTHFTSLHKWMFDFDSMSSAFSESGFTRIARYEFQKGRVPDIDRLDVFPAYSLFMEAEKGS